MKYLFMLLFILNWSCVHNQEVKYPRASCNKDVTCCFNTNKKSAICVKYVKENDDSTFLYFKFKQ